jgi:hypothetical protein
MDQNSFISMTKIRIQFPESLYERIKALAADQKWSVAETLRRGAELLLATRPVAPGKAARQAWSLEPPANTGLVCAPFSNENWHLEAPLGTSAKELAGE